MTLNHQGHSSLTLRLVKLHRLHRAKRGKANTAVDGGAMKLRRSQDKMCVPSLRVQTVSKAAQPVPACNCHGKIGCLEVGLDVCFHCLDGVSVVCLEQFGGLGLRQLQLLDLSCQYEVSATMPLHLWRTAPGV